MSNRLMTFGVVLLATGAMALAEPATERFSITTTATGANVSTSDAVYFGCLDYLYVDITTTYVSPTVTVTIATLNQTWTGQTSRTLFTRAITADGTFPVRQLVVNTSGTAGTDAWAAIPLFNDKLKITLTPNVTNSITTELYLTTVR
jgi:hypothetical protein